MRGLADAGPLRLASDRPILARMAISMPHPLPERAALPAVPAPDSHVARRWEIWHASAPLFEKHGFRAVTVDQLAFASAMSPAGLYHYFPNKAAIACSRWPTATACA